MRLTYTKIICIWVLSAMIAFLAQLYLQSSMTPPQRSLASVSSSHSSLHSGRTVEVCDRAESYVCELRVYGENVPDTTESSRLCEPRKSGGESCVPVLKIGFSSDVPGAPTIAKAKCTNNAVAFGRSMPIEAEAEDVPSALQEARIKCRQMIDDEG